MDFASIRFLPHASKGIVMDAALRFSLWVLEPPQRYTGSHGNKAGAGQLAIRAVGPILPVCPFKIQQLLIHVFCVGLTRDLLWKQFLRTLDLVKTKHSLSRTQKKYVDLNGPTTPSTKTWLKGLKQQGDGGPQITEETLTFLKEAAQLEPSWQQLCASKDTRHLHFKRSQTL